MVVYITGASGYLGKALADYFANKGDQVIALCRKNMFDHPNIIFSNFSLGGDIDKTLPAPDICIHCAYDLNSTKWKDIYETNVSGSRFLFDQLAAINCNQIIHISTFSAFEGCRSKYGKAKLLIEKITEKYHGISIRPGLIYGGANAGLIGKLSSFSRLKIIPMIGSGNYPQYLTPVNDLSEIIYKIAHGRYAVTTPVITLSATEPVTLKNIITGPDAASRPFIVPVFWKIPFFALRVMELFNIRLPFRSDSITGLVFSNPSPDFSFMKENNIVFNPLPANVSLSKK